MLKATYRTSAPSEDVPQVTQSKLQVASTQRLDAETAERREEEARRKRIDDIISELDSMVGLGPVKRLAREVGAFCEVQRMRSREHLTCQPTTMHTVFTGHPGTGKTTVARLFGRLFREMGVLTKGHLVEVERADLVGEYIGHTAQRTRDQVKRALGGILFIDEAYSLARGGEKDFGREAIDCLVKAMEDHKDDVILILAGYPLEMDVFLRTNPGLRSRFPLNLHFPDYSVDELVRIGELMLGQREYRLDVRARTKLAALVSQKQMEDENPGNARTVRNLVERAIRQQAVRLVEQGSVNRDQLITLRVEDLRGL